MKKSFPHISRIEGELTLPGDKSISHRALIFSALAKGNSEIKNLLNSEDINSTMGCLQKLGVRIEMKDNLVLVEGVGRKGFKKPENVLNCGNSGTTVRLLSGVLAVQNFTSVITGDDSLSQRPMQRIIDPLQKMGCIIKSKDGKLPLQFYPADKIEAIDYNLPLPSAQIKGAVLLTAIHIDDITIVIENNLHTRDHTERMLNLPVEELGDTKIIRASSEFYPEPDEYYIPGDISTAAFFIVLTLLSKNSQLSIKNVSLNKTRTVFLDLLIKMGAEIKIKIIDDSNSEPYGDIFVKSSDLKNIEIDPIIVPAIIDEIPILAIAGALAEGEFLISGAEELRIKESDRINSICSNLRAAGFSIAEFDDGFSIDGNINNDFNLFEGYGDHRIAMALSILSCLMEKGSEVNGIESINISSPYFLDQLESIKVQ